MSQIIAYRIDDNLYLNLTNRCSNRCTFCVRDQHREYGGYPLWLDYEPTVDEVIAAIGDPTVYREVVFCGYGEPTYRYKDIAAIARAVKQRGGKTRLNTNGHGNLIAGCDITPYLADIDLVNVSLNCADLTHYEAICRPLLYGAWQGMLDFAANCKQKGIPVRFSVVDVIGEEGVAEAKRLADQMGIPLYVREYIEP